MPYSKRNQAAWMRAYRVNAMEQSLRYPQVALLLRGTDCYVMTVITDKEARANSGRRIKDIQDVLEGLLGEIYWENQRDIPMRTIELFGIHSLLQARSPS